MQFQTENPKQTPWLSFLWLLKSEFYVILRIGAIVHISPCCELLITVTSADQWKKTTSYNHRNVTLLEFHEREAVIKGLELWRHIR